MKAPLADIPFYRRALRRLIAARLAELPEKNGAEAVQLRLDAVRLKAPHFGVCESCGITIDFARLLADPGIRQCGQCGQHYFWEQDANFRFVLRVGTPQERQPYPANLVLGKTRWELPALNMNEDDWARHRADLEAHREFRNLVILRPTPSGKPRWISVTGRPIFDAEGRFAGYRGYARELAGPPDGSAPER
jgi:PAS domain-containing protein